MKICSRCVLDEKVPEIKFDKKGVCNYCRLHDTLCEAFPNDKKGEETLDEIFEKIRKSGKGKKYDCVVGVSGGVDSMYLIDLAKSKGLRPLAVHLDNGWDSEIAVGNIKKCLEELKVDLFTYVIDWEEIRDILLSFMKASLPWVDGPTDMAIVSTLYRVASREKIKYILVGNNFRTEGRQPTEWTHVDGRMIKDVQKKFGTKKLKTFPNFSLFDLVRFEFLEGTHMIKPLYYLNYDKKKAKEYLTKKYGWKDYGGHHHESIFTRFVIGSWLPQKFGIDKRKITFSAQVRSGCMKRGDAIKKLKEFPYKKSKMKEDKEYIMKKFGLSKEEFEDIWKLPERDFADYKSYYPLFEFMGKWGKFFLKLLPIKPMMAFDLKHE